MADSSKNETSALDNQQILSGLEKLVKSERKLMHIILAYIHEVEVRKLHLDLGYESVFKFLTDHHGYSEDAAYARMQGARLLAKVPSLQEKLEEGSISLTQISKVCSAIRAEKKVGHVVNDQQTIDLLSKIENQSIFETRKIIAVELDQPIVEAQSLRPQKDESVLIQARLKKAQFEAFRKAQSLISHSVTDSNIADAIEYLSNFLIKKVSGAKSVSKNRDSNEKCSVQLKTTQSFRVIRNRRRYISIKIRRQLLAEAGGHCSFEQPETGVRCQSRYQLQTDHIVPLSEGGSDEISNLRILCGIHNRDRTRQRERHFARMMDRESNRHKL